MKGDLDDPKALIQEAYKIENITRSECRSIFLDWALSLAPGRRCVHGGGTPSGGIAKGR